MKVVQLMNTIQDLVRQKHITYDSSVRIDGRALTDGDVGGILDCVDLITEDGELLVVPEDDQTH